MKYCFAFLLLAFVGQAAFAQTTASTSRETPKDPLLGPKKMELERFSMHLTRLREACAARNAGETAVHESAVMTAMRQAMEERTTRPLALPSASRDLEKMQEIFMSFTSYTSFDAATPAVAATKFALLDNFQQLLQKQYDALR